MPRIDPKAKFALVSKPVLWSNNGYQGPSDPKVQGGFVRDMGYGGEEWNGDAKRTYRGFRYFKTESKPSMRAYAEYGHLGIVMTAMSEDIQYIVGAACDVELVSAAQAKAVTKAFDLPGVGEELWAMPKVREKFASREEFFEHWADGIETVQWRCPVASYHWFAQPFALPKYPLRPDRMVLAKMHNGFQRLRPDDGIKLLGTALEPDHPIMKWLITKEFDPAFVTVDDRKRGPLPSEEERAAMASAAAARKPYVRYLKRQMIEINALHGLLEEQFVGYLENSGVSDIARNVGGIDVTFKHPGYGEIIAELKPAEEGETKFAIRTAIGQVLEYRHFLRPDAVPLIVLGARPSAKEVAFMKRLGISSAWRDKGSFKFAWI